MKIDPSTIGKGLLEQEEFFLGCWFNMSHEQSLDSDRVSTIVPHNGISELIALYSFGKHYGGDEKRIDVGIELYSILENDLILNQNIFLDVKNELLTLLHPESNRGVSGSINQQQGLILSIAKQLLNEINNNYIELAFNLLIEEINKTLTPELKPQVFENIISLTNSIIGTLISKGHGRQEITSFYRNILTKRLGQSPFSESLDFLKTTSLKEPSNFIVKYRLGSKSLAKLIHESSSEVKFGDFETTYINENLIEAKIEILAISYSMAGINGRVQLEKFIDAFSYILGRETLIIQNKYFVNKSEDSHVKNFTHKNTIPNPIYEPDRNKFINFLNSLDRNSSSKTIGFNNEKISSAFRHYRIGNIANSNETKFLSFWTALESITRDAFNNEKGDDKRVISAAIPCISSDYVCKKLTAFLRTLHKLRILDFTVDGTNINIEGIPNNDFYNHLKNDSFTTELLGKLIQYPFFSYKLQKFISLCKSPKDMGLAIDAHELRVTDQLKRIYRARNIIVHNAGKVENIEFLCANLEHYLKTCLNSMIDLMNKIQTIITPEECFIRYKHIITKVKIELHPALKKPKGADRNKLLRINTHIHSDELLISLIGMHQ